MENRYKIITHIHSSDSHDSWMSKRRLYKSLNELSVSHAFCVEHDKISNHKARVGNLTMINGIEITMEDGAHLIIYNPHENIRNLYDKKCNYSVLLNYLKINKGVLCIPHPFRDNSGILSKKLTSQHQDIIKLTQMIEVIDGKRSYSIDQKEKITTIFAKNQIKLPILVSSTDAHEPINLITSFSYANSIEVGEKKIVFDKIINFHLSDYENGIIARKKDIVLSGIIKLFAIPPMVKILSYIKYQFRYYRNRVSKSDVRFRYSAVQ